LERRKCRAFLLQHPTKQCVAFDVIGGMARLTMTPLSPQRAIKRRDKRLSTLETPVGQLVRP
jgi:hypothetical protein